MQKVQSVAPSIITSKTKNQTDEKDIIQEEAETVYYSSIQNAHSISKMKRKISREINREHHSKSAMIINKPISTKSSKKMPIRTIL
jgi:hypothetical protein